MTPGGKRNLIRVGLLATLTLAGLSLWLNTRDDLAAKILSQINTYSRNNLPLAIEAQGITVRFLPPSAELSGIKIKLKPGVADELEQLEVGGVRGNLDFVQLLAGRLVLSNLVISEPKLSINLDPLIDSSTPSPELNWNEVFSTLGKIPLKQIGLTDARVHFYSKKRNFIYTITAADALAELQRERVSLELRVRESYTENAKQDQGTLKVHLKSFLSKQGFTVEDLAVEGFGSEVTLMGSTNLPPRLSQISGTAEIQTKLESKLIADFLRPFLPSLPAIKGHLSGEGRFSLTKGGPGVQAKVRSTGLEVDEFIIDQVEGEVTADSKHLAIKDTTILSPAGTIAIERGLMNFTEEHKIEVNARSELVDLRQLLVQVRAGEVPVELLFSPQLKCQGKLKPSFVLDCDAEAQASHLEVRSDDKPTSTIVLIDAFSADGKIKITDQEVSYEANVRLKEDTGKSKGIIHYERGFKIDYQTPALNFGNIHTLAGLQLSGSARLEGSTEGDSHAATFDLRFVGRDVIFENYGLGQIAGQTQYRKGTLFFKNLKGSLGSSGYSGEVAVDLLKERVKAQGSTSGANAVDLLKAFEGLVVLPFTLTGTVSADVQAEGPLDFSRLSYQMKSDAQNVSLFGETFQNIKFDVLSKDGEVEIQSAFAQKGQGRIDLTGKAHPNAQVELEFVGQGLTLEESENIMGLDSNLSGKLDLRARMTGHILRPNVQANLAISQLVIDELEFEQSQGQLVLNPNSLGGNISLFGGRLISEFAFPFHESAPFRLKLDANNWDYTTIFTLIGGGRFISEYEATLTGTLNLASERGGIFKSTGGGKIDTLLLRRGPLILENLSPMELSMDNGLASLKDFKLQGPNSRIEARGKNFTHERLDLELAADLDVRLLNIFFPFLDELGGRASLKTLVSGSLFEPKLIGSVSVKEGFTKIRALPHAIEKISAEAQFSRNRVNITRLDGYMAGGTITGGGDIQINGYRNLPTDIDLNLEGVNLNIPPGFQTSGSAKLAVKGSWFPFTLTGRYDIDRGLINKEFTETTGRSSVSQSVFLPRMILKSAFEPLLLDLKVVFANNLLIKNSMMDGAVSGQLQVQGPPNQPGLSGQVEMDRSSRLLFRDKAFEVTAGSAKFNGSNEINPELYVTARSRIEEYDINMIIQGPAKDAVPRLTSIPPLSETDLITLLALGVTSKGLEERVESRAQESSTSYQIGTAILENNPLTKSLQESLGVSFQFSSSYDDESGSAIRKFTVSRKLTDRIRTSVTRAEGQQISTEGKINYQIDQNWSAVGTLQNRELGESSTVSDSATSQSIFGLDLEFRREFR